jgi:hypothetical protein
MVKQYFKGNIKKSDLILGVLIIVFFIVLVTFIFDTSLHESFIIGLDVPQSSIIDIKDHEMERISHFAGSKTCSVCHSDQINNDTICTLICHKVGGIASGHIPIQTWIGNGSSGTILFQHHPNGTIPFGCLSAECHEDPVEPDDARYALMQNANHEYCDICHDFGGHGNGSGGSMSGGSHRTHIITNSKGPDPPLDCAHCHGAVIVLVDLIMELILLEIQLVQRIIGLQEYIPVPLCNLEKRNGVQAVMMKFLPSLIIFLHQMLLVMKIYHIIMEMAMVISKQAMVYPPIINILQVAIL